ncbi:MAG TPA: hypothetical protein PLJ60_03215 [Chryseolinea sp.]|nr:hypothetical protein [Chryseolinea sp.]HPM29323.1 hypothetical protein [Chryseolinea sp.]
MDNTLWEKIAAFNFDDPMSEYGFSTRLATENFWTIGFTQKAILEYKKFMYLAGTSDLMVSPSEIIDIVWHQHLIFTQSYSDLCNIIGKNIQHIPSTHNKEDFEKFKLAKHRTKKLYNENFEAQPPEIWDYSDMYETLHLPKSQFKIRTFIIFGILSFIALLPPLYFLLKPAYLQIQNPYFLQGYIALIFLSFIGLRLYNKSYLITIVKAFKPYSFIHQLNPFELVYLKTQQLQNVVHGNVDTLVKKGTIVVKSEKLKLKDEVSADNIEEFTIIESLKHLGNVPYEPLLKQLLQKPIFSMVANSMDAFKKYFIKSKSFGKLFYLNFVILSIVLMLGLLRLVTGVLRDKPVDLIALILIIQAIVVITFLWRLSMLVCIDTVPRFYKEEILPAREDQKNWDWQYFLIGTAILSPAFVPMAKLSNSSSSGSDSSSCSSGCGSSCSSCGGCGGD